MYTVEDVVTAITDARTGSSACEYAGDKIVVAFIAEQKAMKDGMTMESLAQELTQRLSEYFSRGTLTYVVKAQEVFTDEPNTELEIVAYNAFRRGNARRHARRCVELALPYASQLDALVVEEREKLAKDNATAGADENGNAPDTGDSALTSAKALEHLAAAVKQCIRAGVPRETADSVYETSWAPANVAQPVAA